MSNTDLPNLVLSRRDLLGKSWVMALAAAAKKLSHQPHQPHQKYPAPPFQIGDIVADDWVDEFEVEQTEVGEVVGICWHPKNQRWEYHVNWTGGTMPAEYYPCYDERLTSHEVGAELRLISRA